MLLFLTKTMPTERIDYSKLPVPTSIGCDMLVFNAWITDQTKLKLKEHYTWLSGNSSIVYIPPSNLSDWQFTWFTDISYNRGGAVSNITLVSDEFHFPAYNIARNDENIKVTVYGMLFRFLEIYWYDRGDWYKIFQKIIPYIDLKQMYVNRCDIRFDYYHLTVNELYKIIEESNSFEGRTFRMYWPPNKIETFTLWDRQSCYLFMRCYDKKLELQKKYKDIWYKDYPSEVARLEFEMRGKFLWKDVFDFWKIYNKLMMYTKIDNSIRPEPFYIQTKYDKDQIYDIDVYALQRENRTKKLLKNGVDLRKACRRINQEQKNWVVKVFPRKKCGGLVALDEPKGSLRSKDIEAKTFPPHAL